jgi:hypothetical protein
MIPIYCGYDPLEAVGYHVFCSSVLRRSSEPVSFMPLYLPLLTGYEELHQDGSNGFTYSRFLVPFFQGFKGFAIFADGADMLCRADIAQLWGMRDPFKAVQVVQHDYQTAEPRKYIGTTMEAPNASYPRKNWSSLMLINCEHFAWRHLLPAHVAKMSGAELHRFEFIEDRFVGDLPKEWNWLAREYAPNPEAKIVHYTLGIPAFSHYAEDEHATEWFSELHALKDHAHKRRVPKSAAIPA